MKYIYIYLFIVLFVQISCYQQTTENAQEKPSVGEEKMAAILVETHLAEAYLQQSHPEKRDSFARILYYHIFKMQNVKEADFYQSLRAYEMEPKKLGTIYKAVTDELEKRNNAAQKQVRAKEEILK